MDAMNDEELARYFNERRGDVSQWAKTPKKIRIRRGSPSTVFSIRLTGEELDRVAQAARRKGTTVSDFFREATLKAADQTTAVPPPTRPIRRVADG